MIPQLPDLPGVYFFKDADNNIIYVGKAKSLKNRVGTYFHRQQNDWKVKELIREHATVEFILTKNETEALLLEAQLIREHQPKYNVLLKSGNPFLYIHFAPTKPYPTIELVRTKKGKGTFFGPFLHKSQARGVYTYLVNTFKLFLCGKNIPNGCLDYHIGRCAGSCKPDFDEAGYLTRLELARQALEGNHMLFIETLKRKIAEYSKALEFEKAKHLSEYLKHFDTIFATLRTKFSETKYAHEVTIVQMPHKRPIENIQEGLKELCDLLKLSSPPRTIDCFDISHFQSHALAGSCVRFTDGMPEKNKFRRFKIRSLDRQNDYAALQEIVIRRYKDASELPDVILIDGGKGQLNAVKGLFNVPVVSLAKREERLFTDLHPDGIVLDQHTNLGQLLIALRDYAHHFAITYQRAKYRKEFSK